MAMDLACAFVLASAYKSVSSFEVKVAASGSFRSLGRQYSMFPAHPCRGVKICGLAVHHCNHLPVPCSR